MIQTVLKHGAVYVQPDYRLLPEANGEEVLDDIDDFWTWLAFPALVFAAESEELEVSITNLQPGR